MAGGTQPAATSRTVRAAEPSPTIPPHQAPQENRTAASKNAQANDLPSKSRIVAMAVRRLDLADRTRPGWIVRRLLRCPGGRRSRQRHEKPRESAGLRVSCAWWLWVESKIGRASCRERVCQYVSISVVAVYLKKKKKKKEYNDNK